MSHTFDSQVRAMSVALALAALGTAATVHAQSTPPTHVMYVDASALPDGDGSDWLHAFRDLQDALALVPSNPGGTTTDRYLIKISQGLYKPDRGTFDRTASFVVNSAATLMGSFGGLQSSNPDAWDPAAFTSVLSGDLRGNDGPNFSNIADNSYHVLTLNGSFATSTLKLYALTVRSGNADGPFPDNIGAGLLAKGPGHGEIFICNFVSNRADYGAGLYASGFQSLSISSGSVTDNLGIRGVAGAYVFNSNSSISGVSFQHNWSLGTDVPGGALWAYNSNLFGCTITDNSAPRGAGVSLEGASSILSSVIAGNAASISGGGIEIEGGSTCALTSTLIAHNTAPDGAGIDCGGNRATVTNCTITGNVASSAGGGLRQGSNIAFAATMQNTILWANAAPAGANVSSLGGPVTIEHSIVQFGAAGAMATFGAAVSTIDPAFVDPVGTSSLPTSWADKDYRLRATSPCIDAGMDPPSQYAFGYQDAGEAMRQTNSTCAAYARIDIGAYEFAGTICPDPIPVTYVRASAPLGGNGRSWAGAFRDLQDALATPGVTNIWIAEGVYRADRSTGNRDAVFLVENPSVSLYGGFTGNETSPAQRNIQAHPTILSADLLGNDSPLAVSHLDNAEQLLTFNLPYNSTASAIVSGLGFVGARSITGFHIPVFISAESGTCRIEDCAFYDNMVANIDPDSSAGALTSSAATLVLQRCRFTNNTSSAGGGAASLFAQSLQVTDCLFANNLSGGSGGAMSVGKSVNATLTSLTRCSFIGNAAAGSGHIAGGAASISGAMSIDSCRFIGNIAMNDPDINSSAYDARAGAIDQPWPTSSSSISNSLFAANRVVAPIPGVSTLNLTGSGSVVNCTFADNISGTAFTGSGNIAAINPRPFLTFANCIFWNSPGTGAGPQSSFGDLSSSAGVAPHLFSCLMQGPIPMAAVNTRALNPFFTNPAGPDGIFGSADDDYSLRPDSPAIDAADSSLIPANITLDLAGNPRFFDAYGVVNTGSGTPNYLDIGAFEFTGAHDCLADFNHSGTLSAQDIFDFLSAWFAQSPAADFNHSGSLTSQDIFDFLTAWFAGC